MRSRLKLLTFLCSGAALLLAALVYGAYQLVSMRAALLDDISLLSEVLAEQSREALIRGDAPALDALLERLRERGVTVAKVYGSDGRDIAGFGERAVSRTEPADAVGPYAAGGSLGFSVPVLAGGQMIGHVEVESDQSTLYARLATEGAIGVVVMLVSFALALAASRGMQRRIADPIGLLASTAEGLMAAAPDPPRGEAARPSTEHDELDLLTAAFDALQDAVRSREAELKRAMAHHRALFEHAADPIFVLATDGTIVDVNPTGANEAGCARDTLLGQCFASVFRNTDGSVSSMMWLDTQPGQRRTVAGRYLRWDGSSFPVELHLAAIPDAREREGALVALSRDMTEHHRFRMRLEESQEAEQLAHRAKTRFLGSVNNEIRSPVSAILAMAELLATTPLSPTQKGYLDIVEGSTNTLVGVIDDILELAWTDSGRLGFDSLEFDLCHLVDEIVGLFAERCRRKQLELASRVEPGVPSVLRGDPKHLRQVLLNLLGNAVKFTETGEIELTVESEQDEQSRPVLRFTVRDTGIGVPEALQREIFEPFVRDERGILEASSGRGIGLTISQSLVRATGGSIGVTAETYGGSSFWFTMPFDVPPARTTTAIAPGQNLAGIKVLVVEQNEMASRCIRTQLEYHGASAHEVPLRRGREHTYSRALADHGGFDVVIAGLGPAANPAGISELLTPLIDAAAAANARVVVLQPLADTSHVALADTGVAAVMKPLRQSELVPVLRAVLDGSMTGDPTSSPVLLLPDRAAERRTSRVLVVDDDSGIRASVSLVLSALGHTAIAVRSGREALDRLSGESFDLVLMDCHMRGMDGHETTRQLRAMLDHHTTPVIGMTGNPVDGERDRALSAGMDEILSKPISINSLEALVGTYVGRNAGRHQG